MNVNKMFLMFTTVSQHRRRRGAAALGVTVALSLALWGCGGSSPSGNESAKNDREFAVVNATPKAKRAHLVKDTYPDNRGATWTVLASGVRWRDLVQGDGAELTSHSIGYFHIKTFLEDGTFFHSTMNERKPVCAAIGANRLQRELEEALVGMRERGRRLVEFPSGMRYWSAGHLADGPVLPAGTAPRFDVSLLLVKEQKKEISQTSESLSQTSASAQRKEGNP